MKRHAVTRKEFCTANRIEEGGAKMTSVARSIRRQHFNRTASLLIASLMLMLPALGQMTTGDLVGTATDPSGALLPGATVTVTNQGTGESRTQSATSSGDYAFNQLQPGKYTLKVILEGFKGAAVSDIQISAGVRSRVDARLETGAFTEEVTVNALDVGLQTDSSEVRTSVGEATIQNIPLSGRNYITAVQVAPGVNAGAPGGISSGNRPDDRRPTSSVSANGQSDLQNDFMIDGLDNNERHHGLQGVRPSVDAISEIQVVTNDYRAEAGRTSGAVINLLTKAGTNNFHGTVFEYWGNDALNARNYFGGAGRAPEYRQNQFGGSIGGPIRRDKDFFFASVEEMRFINGQSFISTVPTQYEHDHPGDFSDIGGPVIPAAQQDPVGMKYFALFPSPNLAGTVNNFEYHPKQTQFITTVDSRIDHHFGNGDTLFAYYTYNPASTFVPGQLPAQNGVQAGGGFFSGPSKSTSQGVALDYLHSFTPNLLFALKAGYTRIDINTQTLNAGTNASDKFGVTNGNLPGDPSASGLTPVQVAGYTLLGDGIFIPILNTNNSYQVNGSVSYAKQRHNLKVGSALIRRQLNFLQTAFPTGFFVFLPVLPPYFNAAVNLVQGIPLEVLRQNLLYKQGIRTWEDSVYAQDDWRVASNLTLNLGMRFDLYTPLTQSHNQYANFDPATAGILVAGQTTDSALGVKTDFTNFAPRIGFAYSARPTTVLRGGFGISYFPQDTQAQADNLNPPFSFNYTGLFPTFETGLPKPTAADITTIASNRQVTNLSYKPSDFTTGYVIQSNLFAQQGFGKYTLTAGYVMNLGRRLSYPTDLDRPSPMGPVPAGTPPPPTLYAAKLPFVSNIATFTNGGSFSYNAIQASVQRAWDKGLQINANYTLAHSLSNTTIGSSASGVYGLVRDHAEYDYGNAALDVRHRVAAYASWVLPIAEKAQGPKKILLAGWQLNGLGYWQTGLPFTVTESVSPGGAYGINLPAVTSDRPNVIAKLSSSNPSLKSWFNTSAFSAPKLGTAGNEGNNQLFGPHDRRVDLSCFKTFVVRENLNLQFKAEVFNITNTPNFAAPNSAIVKYDANGIATTAGGFGTITSTAANERPRQMQFALKLSF